MFGNFGTGSMEFDSPATVKEKVEDGTVSERYRKDV